MTTVVPNITLRSRMSILDIISQSVLASTPTSPLGTEWTSISEELSATSHISQTNSTKTHKYALRFDNDSVVASDNIEDGTDDGEDGSILSSLCMTDEMDEEVKSEEEMLLIKTRSEMNKLKLNDINEKLFFAVRMKGDKGYVLLAELIMEAKSDPKFKLDNVRDKMKNNCTLMHAAALCNNTKCMQTLYDFGFTQSQCVDKFDALPLHYACAHDSEDACMFLLGHGANVNAKDNYGSFPLLIALRNNHYSLVKILLMFGVDVHIKNDQGETLLHYQIKGNAASARQDSKTVLRKVQFLVEVCGCSVNRLNRNGEHALFCALDDINVIQYLCDVTSFDVLEKMLSHTNSRGKTMFHVCSEQGNVKAFIALIKCYVRKYWKEQRLQKSYRLKENLLRFLTLRLNEPTSNNDGYSPLHCAVKKGQMEMVKFLLSCIEVRTDSIDKVNGQTAFQLALESKNEELAELFVKANIFTADVNIQHLISGEVEEKPRSRLSRRLSLVLPASLIKTEPEIPETVPVSARSEKRGWTLPLLFLRKRSM